MTQVYDTPKVKPGRQDHDGMQSIAKKEVQHYTSPLPEAQPPPSDPFPLEIRRGTWAGLFVGGLLGLLFGILLRNHTIVIPGWESLFSMGTFTFVFFWTMMGAALGLLVIGTGAIILAPAPPESHPADDGKPAQESL